MASNDRVIGYHRVALSFFMFFYNNEQFVKFNFVAFLLAMAWFRLLN
jgi:hypothetical protein